MKRWNGWQKTVLVIGLILMTAVLYIFWPVGVWPFVVNLDDIAPPPDKYDVTILRDTWGVPHLYGQTDADAAYGLAYAHAEDDFATIQDTLLAASTLLGRTYGADSAPTDYFVHLLRIWDTVEAEFDTIPAESRAILEAYAEGINHYAALHEEEVLTADLFPLTGQDIAAANLLIVPVFFGLDTAVSGLFAAEQAQAIGNWVNVNYPITHLPITAAYGSNVFAVSPARSANGETFLAVNSHQPWSGPATWYEAHLHSEEGLNVVGGLFPSAPLIILGHNEHLGWSFTVNSPDLVDTYELEINPENPDQYRFDGEWLDLEVRPVTLWVKIIGRLVIPVRQEVLWSVYGPTVRPDHGTYALRYAGMGDVDLLEQFRQMNKAATFAEWLGAMRDGPLPMFNTGYADDQGNIYYVYNAKLPLRSEGYDWSGMLPGNTSETLWTEYLPYDELPQVTNPASGFIQNANSTPFQTTIGPENPQAGDYSVTFGIEPYMTNRALQAIDLFAADDSMTADEFYTLKYNMAYHPDSDVAKVRDMLVANPPAGDENVQEAIEILGNWDLVAGPESEGTAVIVLIFHYFYESEQLDLSPSRLVNTEIPLAVAQEAFLRAVNLLVEKFGRVNVPWREVNRLIRGDADLGMGGGPDLLHAVYGELGEDGRFHGFVGDSYIMLVEWDADGNLTSQSIHQYGSATSHPDSPHYADQAPLFANRQLKPVWLNEAEIRANLEREYRPGE
jgi:penicillin amidase/acyl-homoserine-lactone acylase